MYELFFCFFVGSGLGFVAGTVMMAFWSGKEHSQFVIEIGDLRDRLGAETALTHKIAGQRDEITCQRDEAWKTLDTIRELVAG